MKKLATYDDLRDKVGTIIGVSEPVWISAKLVADFAELTGDLQWIHIDADRCATELGKKPIAHAYLLLSMVSTSIKNTLYVDNGVFVGPTLGMVIGIKDLKFIRPVPIDSSIYYEFKLTGVKKINDHTVEQLIAVTTRLCESDKITTTFTIVGRNKY
jgi:acyl dehydratase